MLASAGHVCSLLFMAFPLKLYRKNACHAIDFCSIFFITTWKLLGLSGYFINFETYFKRGSNFLFLIFLSTLLGSPNEKQFCHLILFETKSHLNKCFVSKSMKSSQLTKQDNLVPVNIFLSSIKSLNILNQHRLVFFFSLFCLVDIFNEREKKRSRRATQSGHDNMNKDRNAHGHNLDFTVAFD